MGRRKSGGQKWQESDTLRWSEHSESWQLTVIVTWSQKKIFVVVFLPDGDNFVTESSNETVLDEPVYVFFGEKGLESVCLPN